VLKKVCIAIGLDHNLYKSHSFRIGAANSFAMKDVRATNQRIRQMEE